VPVTLLDQPLSVDLRGGGALAQQHRVESEPHGAALVLDVALLGQQVDHVVRRRGIELGGIGALEPAHVARVLDHRALHAEADPEIGHALLARVADGLDLPLDAPAPEAAGHQMPSSPATWPDSPSRSMRSAST